ncbi:hypothetical protein TIFTF001_016848 [Ficus carica]|uniref:Uncharacterized protein n=1 Tax=Ficus carica TaxID=3494 RepID=A0AA88A712_FICCA|nr:hypothetical protein TIFTF001_016848 [Ficus carica]
MKIKAWKLLVQILLFSWLINIQLLSSGAPIARPNCPTHCGIVSIPYPFGIRAGCFLDEWFEVVCKNSRPLLNRTDWEVTEFNVADGTIRVRNYWSLNETLGQTGNIEGSPFELAELVNVPIVLKWELLNYSTFDVFGTSFEPNKTNDFPRNYWNMENEYKAGYDFMNSSCEFYNYTSSRLQCSCPQGYEGNPYLIEGCQDIDECTGLNRTGRCIEGTDCINVGGSFLCFAPSGKSSSRVKQILIGYTPSGRVQFATFGEMKQKIEPQKL